MSRAYVSKPPPAPRGGSAATEHAAAPTSARNRRRDRDRDEKQDPRDVRNIAEENSSSDCICCTVGREVEGAAPTARPGKRTSTAQAESKRPLEGARQ